MGDTIDKSKLEEIPQPPEYLFGLLGNLPDVDPSFASRSFMRLMDLYGPIYKLQLKRSLVLVGNQELANEVYDQDRFKKVPSGALVELRALLGDGLFTAYLEEPNWGIAHRLLVPAFGPLGLRKMFNSMLDISTQMVLKWDRLGPQHAIDCADDFTRLAFDTIGICAFNYRFNEFYTDHAHPFATQMAEVLVESGKRNGRTAIQNALYYRSEQHRQENVRKMHQLCDEIVRERKENPRPDVDDLLNIMLNSTDKETGKKLSDENIRYQMATFLVAGHETTSSTLSFLWYNFTQNPDKMHLAQKEVDEVVGDNILTAEMLSKLSYIDACIKESQRMYPTIGANIVRSQRDQVLAGRYFVPKDQETLVLLNNVHHDRKVWGDDVDVFRPERFLNGGFQKLPPNSWKPFGNGSRACIGRGLAEQEMLMNTALLLQRFQLEAADKTYELELKSTLTIKPAGFKMRVRRRPGKSLLTGIPGGVPTERAQAHRDEHERAHTKRSAGGKMKPVTVLFGGNSGTCEAMAQSLAGKGEDFGLQFDMQGLDAGTEALPTDHPVVVITASYEGKPPDNAKKFVSWIEQLAERAESLPKGIRYAVYGVGNSDWVSTFHRIPRLVDEVLEKLGAERLVEAGYSNVKEDLVGPWEEWSEMICQSLSGAKGETASAPALDVSIQSSSLSKTLGGDQMALAIIVKTTELADTSAGPSKRHMELRLPEGASYTSGDYLVVQGRNPDAVVSRVLRRFALSEEDLISIKDTRKRFLPSTPTPITEFLSTAVELSGPVTKRQLAIIAEHSKQGSEEQKLLESYQEEAKYKDILSKRYSILDILEDFNGLDMPFAAYVDMLQPLVPRQYSISSSPLHPTSNPANLKHPDIVSITYDVHTSPALSGHGTFEGVASNYLATRRPGDRISCFVRPTNVGFRIPGDPKTPLILIAAGTGIAPMRAFLQERAAIQAAGVKVLGPAMLFFGCRSGERDFIYKDELAAWEEQGVVEVVTAFSRPEQGEGRYVSDALWEHRERVAEMFRDGGKIFLCGSAARLGKSTADMCKKIYREKSGRSEEEADEWLSKARTERYVSDVY